MFVVGIDAGATKTLCQLATDHGEVMAEARGPGANLQAVGELEVEKVLHDVIDHVLGVASVHPDVICLGMAGVDRPEDARVVHDILLRIGHKARPLVVNDALIALEAGVPGGPGIVIVAGTGSIAYGRDRDGHAARAGGWGYVLGDEGSGYWLGRQALRAVVREADRRGPPTMLTPRILARYNVAHAQDLVRHVYHDARTPSAIATLANEVEAAATGGDQVAQQILNTGAEELASAAISVAIRLGLDDCPVILAGGVFRAAAGLRAAVTKRIADRLPRAKVEPLTSEPALGAVRLALAMAAGQSAVPTYVDAAQ